jgi:hypothetical protein
MSRFWSDIVHTLTPYVPGEQPRIDGLVKLNTNECPYGPSERVLAAIAAASGDPLRLYPDPQASALKEAIARHHGLNASQVFVGNGSVLTGVAATVASGAKFSMYRSNNQTIFSNSSLVGANINYDGIIFDTHSACNVSTGSFTAPLSGYYQFITSTTFPDIDTAGTTFEIRLVKNTTQPIAILNNPWFPGPTFAINTRTTYPARALVNLTAGDVVNVRAFNQIGVSVILFGNSSTNFTRFSGYYVGA